MSDLQLYPGLEAQLAASEDWPLYKRMLRFRRVHRLTGWKFWALISGGATLPPEIEIFWGRLGYAVIQGYGMTETAALITLNHPFHVGRGTLGKPLPGREVRISPEGEIMVRGDVVSGSTWTDGRIQQRSSAWLATGDLATQDAAGEIIFSGRRGDVIVTAAGLNIYPADLEAALLKQPGVRAAAVVACEGPNGPEPVAVLLADGAQAEQADDLHLSQLLQQANHTLADFQQIRHLLRWPEPSFPFTFTGKLLRRVVAEWACGQLAASAAHPAAVRGDILLEMIASVTGESPADTADSARLTEDLHLDSLGRVQLQSLLEQRFGIELNEEQIAQAATLGELRTLTGSFAGPLSSIAAPTALPTPPASPTAPPAPQAAEKLDVSQGRFNTKGTGFGPYINATKSVGFSPRGNAYGRISVETRPSSATSPASTSVSAAAPSPPIRPLQHRYPRWVWLAPVSALRIAFQELILRPLVRLLAAPRVNSRAPSTPDSAPAPLLIIANHITAYDAPLVLYGLPRKIRRHVAIAMSGEMLLDYRRGSGAGNALLNPLMPVAYWLLTVLMNVFPLPRLGGFRRSFEHAGRALDRGYNVLIFPEGHRSADGTLQAFRSGIGLLAQQSEADVLPVALAGLGEILRTDKRWFRSGRVTVHVGAPIPYDPDRTPEQTTHRLQEAIAELLS